MSERTDRFFPLPWVLGIRTWALRCTRPGARLEALRKRRAETDIAPSEVGTPRLRCPTDPGDPREAQRQGGVIAVYVDCLLAHIRIPHTIQSDPSDPSKPWYHVVQLDEQNRPLDYKPRLGSTTRAQMATVGQKGHMQSKYSKFNRSIIF